MTQLYSDKASKNDLKNLYFPITLLDTFAGVNVYYAKYGKIVEVIIIGRFNKAQSVVTNNGLVIATLPSGFTPASTRLYDANFMMLNAGGLGVSVMSDGEIKIITLSEKVDIPNGSYFNACIHFMIY